jgi:thymidylate synthase
MKPDSMFCRACILTSLLSVISWGGLVGCATGPQAQRRHENVYPETTTQRVSLTPAEVESAITPANAFNLTPHERKLYAKRAAKGDLEAAGKLARFYGTNHEGRKRTKRDDEKADYWQRVVDRLEKQNTTIGGQEGHKGARKGQSFRSLTSPP